MSSRKSAKKAERLFTSIPPDDASSGSSEESISGPEDYDEDNMDVEEEKKPAAKSAAAAAASSSSSSGTGGKKKKSGGGKAKEEKTSKRTGPGSKKTKPPGETQNQAKARCEEMRTKGMALLSTLDLDKNEADLIATGRRTLRDSQDEQYISPINTLLRSQIELFEATEDHPRASCAGQIGLRCLNCANANYYGKGVEKFCSNMNLIDDAVRNWHRTHIIVCPSMPDDIKAVYDQLKEMKIRAGNRGINYYELSNKRLGLEDIAGGGIRLKEGSEVKVATSSGNGGAASAATAASAAAASSAASYAPSTPPPKKKAKTNTKVLGKEPKPATPAAFDGAEGAAKAAAFAEPDEADFAGTFGFIPEPIGSDSDDDAFYTSATGTRRRAQATGSNRGSGRAPLTTNKPREVEALDLVTMQRKRLFDSASEAARIIGVARTKVSRLCRKGGGVIESSIGSLHYRYVDTSNVSKDVSVDVSDIAEYIERVRNDCSERASRVGGTDSNEDASSKDDAADQEKKPPASSAGKSGQDEDEDDSKERSATSAEEKYGETVDKLMRQVELRKGNGSEEKKEMDEDRSETAREQLIRHQLMQRIKTADKAGIGPEEFSARFLAQIRANERREDTSQMQRDLSGQAAAHSNDEQRSGRKKKPSKTTKKDQATAKPKKKQTQKKPSAGEKRKREGSAKSNEKGKGRWSEEEDQMLEEAVKIYGHNWDGVASYIKTRTSAQCKSRNQKLQIKKRKTT